jgi:ketopantoate reductase
MTEFNPDSLNELCALISSLIKPDSNSTFLEKFNPLMQQCQQTAIDGSIFAHDDYVDLVSLQIRQTLFLQNLKNLLWTNIEYQMGKITKKSTKKAAQAPVHSIK